MDVKGEVLLQLNHQVAVTKLKECKNFNIYTLMHGLVQWFSTGGGIPHQRGILHLQGGDSVFRILFKM